MNADENTGPALDDPRLVAALDEYLAALEAGGRPDRQEFLARHAEIAGPLAECLDGMEFLHQASSAGRPAAGGPGTAEGQVGTALGDFRIVREVGRGGMGVVYEAEQISLGRRIALKVLPFALTLDPRQLQRFKNEARAAAQLHHQHIVPVYYVGSERGVHFYAMQYIEGQSLAEVIEGLRQLRRTEKAPASSAAALLRRVSRAEVTTGPYVPPADAAADSTVVPTGSLVTAYSQGSTPFYRAVARLGVQAAQALEHAHEYGIVHRDIKPGNLLLDGHGNVWVTDFGLAQFQADAGLTQTGDLLGTLRYMSPEQAGGQRVLLDHRSDVYSLGATLYELLTLRPPFDGGDRQTLLRQILHDEPRPPRALDKSVPAELETIVLKALAKAPAERYATARELADDLERYLRHEPIRARRPTWPQRARKWARRHPSVAWSAVVLCLLTAAGSLVSAAVVRTAYEQERQRAQEAEERFLLAREAVDGVFKLCEEELADRPQLDGLRRRLLEDLLVYYEKLIEQRGDDPAGQAELAATRGRVQQILGDLAVLQGAGQLPLLSDHAVLDDLGLAGEPRDKVAELSREMGRQAWDLSRKRLPAEEGRQRFLELARSKEAEVEQLLTPGQLQRLGQIDLQKQGPRAFEDSRVVAALKLTAGQRERIRAITSEPVFGPRPPEPRLPPVAKVVKTVLTEEQARRWKELTGKEFKEPPRPRPGPPPGRRP
jgi:serine/threonine protein kinase